MLTAAWRRFLPNIRRRLYRLPWAVAGLWAGSRCLIFIIALAAAEQMPKGEPVPFLQRALLSNIVQMFGTRWDAGWYLQIAQQGYTPQSIAFFPLYPLLLSWGSALTGWSLPLTGFLLSNVLALAAGYLLWRLARREFGEAVAFRAVTFLYLAPASLYLSANYTESLYLAASLAAWAAGFEERWWWAGLLGALASLTRPTGILLLPAMMVWYLLRHQWRPPATWRTLKDMTGIGVTALGALSYYVYLFSNYGGLTGYLQAQAHWGRHVGPLVIAQMLWHVPGQSNLLLQGYLPGLVLAGVTVALMVMRRYQEAILVAGTLLLSIGTGSFESVQRFALTLFPLHLLLGRVPSERTRALLLAASTALLGYWTALYGGGWFFT